jgi:hypothetical protein
LHLYKIKIYLADNIDRCETYKEMADLLEYALDAAKKGKK